MYTITEHVMTSDGFIRIKLNTGEELHIKPLNDSIAIVANAYRLNTILKVEPLGLNGLLLKIK